MCTSVRGQRSTYVYRDFVIMMPIATQTGDPVKGWEAGLAWVFRAELRADGRRLHRSRDPEGHAARRAAGNAWPGFRSPLSRCVRALEMFMTP